MTSCILRLFHSFVTFYMKTSIKTQPNGTGSPVFLIQTGYTCLGSWEVELECSRGSKTFCMHAVQWLQPQNIDTCSRISIFFLLIIKKIHICMHVYVKHNIT